MQIDIGGQKKQIVAGLRTNYAAEDLTGKKIIVINNLDPVTIRGEESNGMLLAAKDEDLPVILTPESDVPSGASVG